MTGEVYDHGGASFGWGETLPERERRLLAQWLREWRCEQALGERSDRLDGDERQHDLCRQAGRECPPDECASFVTRALPTGRPPAVRQIRLLHPADTGLSVRPLFVALLARPACFLFRVVPFGRFAVPAVPTELETGRPEAPLRVLCAWNARSLHSSVLARAWVVGRLTGDESTTAAALDRHEKLATWLDGYAERTGPRLRHPADPRHVYLRQEAAIMDRVCRDGASGADTYAASIPWPELLAHREGDISARLAAEAVPAYGGRLVWRVALHDSCVELDPPVSPDQPCRLTVRSADGLVSDRLDGVTVVGRRRLTRISGGHALILGSDLLGGLRLYDAGGMRLRLDVPPA